MWGASRKKKGYLKDFYHKLLIQKGCKKALVAVSHKIIKATFHILKEKTPYKEPLEQIEKTKERKTQKEIQKSVIHLNQLGFSVRLTPTA